MGSLHLVSSIGTSLKHPWNLTFQWWQWKPLRQCYNLTSHPSKKLSLMNWTNKQKQRGLRDAFHLLNWLSLACGRKLQKCSLVFKCLNNLVPKYLTEYFIRSKAFHDYGARESSNMHPPEPKTNMGKRTFKYAGTIHFNFLPAALISKLSHLLAILKVC